MIMMLQMCCGDKRLSSRNLESYHYPVTLNEQNKVYIYAKISHINDIHIIL